MVQRQGSSRPHPGPTRALAFADETNRLVHEDIVGSAHLAFQKQNNLDAAAAFQPALKTPTRSKARRGLKLLDGLKSGKSIGKNCRRT